MCTLFENIKHRNLKLQPTKGITIVPNEHLKHEQEINFIIQKFFELTKTVQRQIYDRLRSKEKDQQNSAGVQLLQILTRNAAEFASLTHQTNYIVDPAELDAIRESLVSYFKTGLKQAGDSRTFTIPTIP